VLQAPAGYAFEIKTISGNSRSVFQSGNAYTYTGLQDDVTGPNSAWTYFQTDMGNINAPVALINLKPANTGNEVSWTFDAVGNLTVPGNIGNANIVSANVFTATGAAPMVSSAGNLTLLANSASWNFNQTSQINLPGGTAYISSAANTITMYSDVDEFNGMLFYDGGAEVYSIGDYAIFTDNAGTGNIWRFYGNGTSLSPALPVASLPSPTAAGLRAFVNDSNLAAAGNFGEIVGNGASNVVPVYSDGSNWRIG
jgi:hypothetical protein